MRKIKSKFGVETITAKITLLIVISFIVITTILILYSAIISHRQVINEGEKSSVAIAVSVASDIRSEMESCMDAARTMAQLFSAIKDNENREKISREMANSMINKILVVNNSFHGAYTLWEPNAFDGKDAEYANTKGHDITGRFIPYWSKDETGRINHNASYDYEEDNAIGSFYQTPKETLNEVIIDPAWFAIQNTRRLLIAFVAPILHSKRFFGITGIDLDSKVLQSVVNRAKLDYEKSSLCVVSHNGIIAADTDQENVGKHMRTFHTDWSGDLRYIHAGKKFVDADNHPGEIEIIIPIKTGRASQNWAVIYRVSQNEIAAVAQTTITQMVVISLLLVLGCIIVIIFILKKLLLPLGEIAEMFSRFATGNLEIEYNINSTGQEIDNIVASFEKLVSGLKEKANFAKQIGSGDLKADFVQQSDYDTLGLALIEMRNSLTEAKIEEQKRKKDDKQRTWTTRGIAEFSDILRKDNNNINILGNEIVKKLVKYLKAVQCGLFVINNDSPDDIHLTLSASYAYDRKKFLTKRIEMKEGLVGMCAMERQTIYITEIPADYMAIKSGLGTTPPKSILIIPLKTKDEILGVIELASLNEFFPHEIEFCESICGNIAATVMSVKISQQTTSLLEQSRYQAEEMAAQEEEMRQNMEELQATQEEAARREAEMHSIVNALDEAFLVCELNKSGQIITMNEPMLQFLQKNEDHVRGEDQLNFFSVSADEMVEYERFWNSILGGRTMQRLHSVYVNNYRKWLSQTYTPIFDNDGSISKIMQIAIDATENQNQHIEIEDLIKDTENKATKLQEQEKTLTENFNELKVLQQQSSKQSAEMTAIINGIHNSFHVAEYNLNGIILNMNQRFLKLLNFDKSEVLDKQSEDVFREFINNHTEYSNLWIELQRGKYKRYTQHIFVDDKEIWLNENYLPIRDNDNRIIKVLNIAVDVTNQKKQEIEINMLLENMQKRTDQFALQEEIGQNNIAKLLKLQGEAEARAEETEKKYHEETLSLKKEISMMKKAK